MPNYGGSHPPLVKEVTDPMRDQIIAYVWKRVSFTATEGGRNHLLWPEIPAQDP